MPLDVRAAFLRAIAADPYDDAPRMVFADWLQENREYHRAVFIRAQCELARIDLDDRRRPGLEAMERDLLKRHEACWRAELPKLGCIDHWGEFRRGFADSLRVPGGSARLATIVAGHPVTRLDVGGMGAMAAEDLVRCHAVSRIRELRVGGTCWPVLLRKPSWPELRRLEVSGNAGVWVSRLRSMRAFPTLESLSVADCQLGPEVARWLIDADHWRDLADLNLRNNGLWAPAEVAQRFPATVTRLDLSLNYLNGDSLRRLLRPHPFRHLRTLRLASNGLNDIGARRLADSPMPRLRELDLSANGITAAGVRVLTAAPWWRQLRSVNLTGNPINPAGAVAVLESDAPHLRRVGIDPGALAGVGRKPFRERFPLAPRS